MTLSALSGPLLGGIAVSAHNPAALSAVRVEHVTTSSGGGLSAPSGVTTATTSASDNDAGELTSQTYPDGDTLSMTYDSASGWMSNESMLPFAHGPIAAATYLLANESYSGAAGALGRLTSATLDFYGGASGGGLATPPATTR